MGLLSYGDVSDAIIELLSYGVIELLSYGDVNSGNISYGVM